MFCRSRETRVETPVRTRRAARQRGLAGSTTLLLVLAVLLGLAAGIGGYTMVYAEAFSYMSSESKVCANCHIMQPQYDSWQKSSHHAVAGCADCHLPHDFVGKYVAKAVNGYQHSKGFTLQDFDEPITIKAANSRILQQSCLACHRDLVHEAAAETGRGDEMRCVHCHQSVGHGERTGLGGPRS
jgi:cytochrome c nitrite reductase small subunit